MQTEERKAAVEEGFIQGVAWAAAIVAQLHGQLSISRSIVGESGFELKSFSVAAEDDLAPLRHEIAGLPRGRD